jgi:hypothetical protein
LPSGTLGRARLLIAEPLESWFEDSLEEARTRTNIPHPSETGIVPGKRSILANIVYAR